MPHLQPANGRTPLPDPMNYAVLKAIHVGAVILTASGFLARGIGMLGSARWLQQPLARRLPHVIDTVLLASALGLAWQLRASPLTSPWIAAKIAGLAAYIGLGSIALRFGRTRAIRAAAWIGALAVFAFIVSVAITKDPRGFLSH